MNETVARLIAGWAGGVAVLVVWVGFIDHDWGGVFTRSVYMAAGTIQAAWIMRGCR